MNSEERSPLNFTRAEWQQASRAGRDPRAIKEAFQDCWAISDGPKAFRAAMEARGYYLARGDRRGHVAVDYRGEVYSIAKWTGARTKNVKAKLGDPDRLPSVDDVKAMISEKVEDQLQRFASEAKSAFEAARLGFAEKRRNLVANQRVKRKALSDRQAARTETETVVRATRFRKGFKGLWDRVTGCHAEIRRRNEAEAAQAKVRDEAEKQALIDRQLDERRALQHRITASRERLELSCAS